MSGDKLYYVKYTGAGVVTLGRAGKFMPGTGAYLTEAVAKQAAALDGFVVEGLGEDKAAKANGAAAATPAPAPAAEASPAPAPAPTPPPAAPPLAKLVVPWHSERTRCDTRLARWGHAGTAVLILPPWGGDAEDIEREQLIDALRPLLDAGKLKVWSCDEVAGRALMAKEGPPQHRMWLMNQFQEYVAREVVPAIRTDGATGEIVVAGAGIGALHAAALVCRRPDLFSRALCASGSYRVERLLETDEVTDDLRAASPLHLVAALGEGETLARLRTRFVLLPCGEGKDEDIGESWDLARALGDKEIPNRVEPLGAGRGRDWVTWRTVFPRLLAEWAG